MALLQTLVMSVVLSTASVMMMKWVLARYVASARNYRNTETKVHTQGYMQERFSRWNFNTSGVSSSGSAIIDGKTVNYKTSGAGNTMRTFVLSSDEDQ